MFISKNIDDQCQRTVSNMTAKFGESTLRENQSKYIYIKYVFYSRSFIF